MIVTRVVLIGLSGSGKSTVGLLLAEALGWTLVDTDSNIERIAGRTIPELFAQAGEAEFRQLEQHVMSEALERSSVVIATGGGAVVNDQIWTKGGLNDSETLTVWLDTSPELLLERLSDQQRRQQSSAVRPLLQGDDPLTRLSEMRRDREPYYRRADLVIPVGEMDAGKVSELLSRVASPERTREVQLNVPGGVSRIRIGDGIHHQLPEIISERWPDAGVVWVIADEHVAEHYLDIAVDGLSETGFTARGVTFQPGETSKSITGITHLYDAMLSGGIERSDVVVALGGGVTGDLVGFAAATVLRGVGLVQMPTSLLAMVDSSVGGKTGINHLTGKNLIGAFYQPAVVLVDPLFLRTLPEREYRAGWAEIIKHGLIEPSTPVGESGLLALIQSNTSKLLDRSSPLLAEIVARNIEIKASVVATDEREAGLRAILNFGHTIGHAIEAAGYQLLHGEAVAVGSHGAMQLAVALERVDASDADRVRALLSAFGLPASVVADVEEVRTYMMHDKKRLSGNQQWVLPVREGGVVLERCVPDAAVERALRSVISAKVG